MSSQNYYNNTKSIDRESKTVHNSNSISPKQEKEVKKGNKENLFSFCNQSHNDDSRMPFRNSSSRKTENSFVKRDNDSLADKMFGGNSGKSIDFSINKNENFLEDNSDKIDINLDKNNKKIIKNNINFPINNKIIYKSESYRKLELNNIQEDQSILTQRTPKTKKQAFDMYKSNEKSLEMNLENLTLEN